MTTLQQTDKLNWSQPRWKRPYKVVEVTSYCVKVWLTENRLSNRIHKTHCTAATDPTEQSLTEVQTDLRTTKTDSDTVNDSQNLSRS